MAQFQLNSTRHCRKRWTQNYWGVLSNLCQQFVYQCFWSVWRLLIGTFHIFVLFLVVLHLLWKGIGESAWSSFYMSMHLSLLSVIFNDYPHQPPRGVCIGKGITVYTWGGSLFLLLLLLTVSLTYTVSGVSSLSSSFFMLTAMRVMTPWPHPPF